MEEYNKKDMSIYYVTLKFDNKYTEQLEAKEICKKINVKYLINKD